MRRRPDSSVRALIVTGVAGLLLPLGAQAQVAGPKPAPTAPVASELPGPAPTSRGAVAFDAMVVRPLSFAVLPIGVALFVPAALTTAPNGRESVKNALDFFITNPANYVFQRPLGEF